MVWLITVIFISIMSEVTFCERSTPEFRLYYMANRMGEIGPTGCAADKLGGLSRLAGFFVLRGNDKLGLLVDAGDSFFPHSSLNKYARNEETEKARLIADVYKRIGLHAFSPGERDFAAGYEVLEELRLRSGAQFISTNLVRQDGSVLYERFIIHEFKGFRVLVLSMAEESDFRGSSEIKVVDGKTALKHVLKETKKQKPNLTILLSHLELSSNRRLAQEELGIDIIVGSHSMDVLSQPEVVSNTVILQPQPEGSHVGVLDYDLAKPSRTSHRLEELSKRFNDDSVEKALQHFKKYKKVHWTERKPTYQTQYSAHPFACRQCHQAQHDFWAKTKHASAYLVLYAKNQHFDPECISCHSIGFGEPGGFSKIAHPIRLKHEVGGEPFVERLMKQVFADERKKGAIKPLDSRMDEARYQTLHDRYNNEINQRERKNEILNLYIGVQCEHCHGNRLGHPQLGVKTVKKVEEKFCLSCHSPPNDMDFKFERDKAKIACRPLLRLKD